MAEPTWLPISKLFIRPFDADCPIDAFNARKRPDFEKKLHASIVAHGLWVPLLVAEAGRRFQVVDGVSRLKVLSELGADRVPVEFFVFGPEDTSEDMKRSRILIEEINRRLDKRWDTRCDGLVKLRVESECVGTLTEKREALGTIARDFDVTRKTIEDIIIRTQGKSLAPLWMPSATAPAKKRSTKRTK